MLTAFSYISMVLVGALGIAGMLALVVFVWMQALEYFAQTYTLSRLFFEFLEERKNRVQNDPQS